VLGQGVGKRDEAGQDYRWFDVDGGSKWYKVN
jgi:hypothetical protein